MTSEKLNRQQILGLKKENKRLEKLCFDLAGDCTEMLGTELALERICGVLRGKDLTNIRAFASIFQHPTLKQTQGENKTDNLLGTALECLVTACDYIEAREKGVRWSGC